MGGPERKGGRGTQTQSATAPHPDRRAQRQSAAPPQPQPQGSTAVLTDLRLSFSLVRVRAPFMRSPQRHAQRLFVALGFFVSCNDSVVTTATRFNQQEGSVKCRA